MSFAQRAQTFSAKKLKQSMKQHPTLAAAFEEFKLAHLDADPRDPHSRSFYSALPILSEVCTQKQFVKFCERNFKAWTKEREDSKVARRAFQNFTHRNVARKLAG